MLESHISTTELTNREPVLSEFYRTGETDLSTIIIEAKKLLISMCESKGINTRSLCKRLTLSDGVKSDEDVIGRRRLVVYISGLSSNSATILLEGLNSGDTYSTVISSQTISTNGKSTYLIGEDDYRDTGIYKYYKITKGGNGTMDSAYLVEASFEYPHTCLSLYLAFKKLEALKQDFYNQKAIDYWNEFQSAFNSMDYSVDSDDDEDIDDNDETQQISITTIVR